MFDGFSLDRIDVGEAQLRVRHGGSGPPLLLLHGHPRTHTTWYLVAPILARRFTVVCPDLRGYGESSKPPDAADHAQMGKRTLASDGVALMQALGHARFAVAGHDRGLYVAYRMALDFPERVSHLIVMDGVPIGEALRRADAGFASAWWHWFFFGQTAKPAERVISQDPDAWYTGSPQVMGEENHADFRRATETPRPFTPCSRTTGPGSPSIGSRTTRIRPPDDGSPARPSSRGRPGTISTSSTRIWREWATDVRGVAIESGHHMAEEAPEAVAAAIGEFLSETTGSGETAGG